MTKPIISKALVLIYIFSTFSLLYFGASHYISNDIKNKRKKYNLSTADVLKIYDLKIEENQKLFNILKFNFSEQLKSYWEYKSALELNFFYSILFSIFFNIVFIKKIQDFKIPKIDISLPIKWILLLLPVCLLYLFLTMGLSFQKLIHSRVSLWRIASLLENVNSIEKAKQYWFMSRVSLKNLDLDFFFIDGWFYFFEPNQTLIFISVSPIFNGILLGSIGMLIGIIQGSMLFILIYCISNYAHGNFELAIYSICFILLSTILHLGHVAFYFGPNWNWVQGIILSVSIIWLILSMTYQ